MNVLFLGSETGTSKHRAEAIARLGHQVHHINPDRFVPQQRVMAKLNWETGGLFCQRQVAAQVQQRLDSQSFEVIWVDNGRYVGPALIQELQRRFGPVLNYNVDDPYGKRDRYSWALYQKSAPFYDLVAVVREENIAEAKRCGARRVVRVYRAADEVAHAPRILNTADWEAWRSEVVFVGTWMPERGAFMAELVRRGVPLALRGDHWQRSPQWTQLQPYWKGPGTRNDEDYARAIQGAKICLGLLSKGNRDMHTTRSLEIPSLGGLFCAERTSEHQYLYCDGEEAVFWSSAAECAEVCHALLADEAQRQEIARKGRLRCIQNGTFNELVACHLLDLVMER